MTTERVRWGILGAGNIARTFVGDLVAQGLEVAAVASREATRAAEFAAELSIPTSYGSYEALVADPGVDVIYIATPQAFHAEQALLAIDGGKPVLVEKSFTNDAPEAERVVAAARAKGVFVMEAMWTRFLPTADAIGDVLERGSIGELVSVSSSHFQNLDVAPTSRHGNPQLGGGVMADLGVYGISFASRYLGEPTSMLVDGEASELGVDLSASVLLRHGAGRTSATLTRMDAPGSNRAAIVGSDGWIDIDSVFYASTSFTVYDGGGGQRELLRFDKPQHVGRGMQFQALEVERCLSAGELESPRMPLDESIAIMRTLDEVRARIAAARSSSASR
ncbi:oxidoreductase [Pseudoclavibacter sp. RFBJ3]|uniref:Gfo/Idh/MocA family protein n=1 Tax=unclassified Pseudoclavibacter TaxID=2615177 RepID=UPI000CE7211A|nr:MULTISPECIES: Gfo/Idh/MocA family oxidoreductase [unclassified Pseudoclavibacter]PPF84204.1 oxidoreductase [Pseudoclavibacter sp. RFBJ5]PPF92895.1 oxidoreductase [Pseudoclavibacter sp. RFBJ3]PPF98032.1 oxidoreductase [Pseudoclavibacter sp. RFBH5]PPG25102.1 oxidoreductase [Pseudoclavibacter sp. RFBI4]